MRIILISLLFLCYLIPVTGLNIQYQADDCNYEISGSEFLDSKNLIGAFSYQGLKKSQVKRARKNNHPQVAKSGTIMNHENLHLWASQICTIKKKKLIKIEITQMADLKFLVINFIYE